MMSFVVFYPEVASNSRSFEILWMIKKAQYEVGLTALSCESQYLQSEQQENIDSPHVVPTVMLVRAEWRSRGGKSRSGHFTCHNVGRKAVMWRAVAEDVHVHCVKAESQKSQHFCADGKHTVARCDYIKELKSTDMDFGVLNHQILCYSSVVQHHRAKLSVQWVKEKEAVERPQLDSALT